VPSVVAAALPTLPLLDVSTGSDPMFLAGCIFYLGLRVSAAEGTKLPSLQRHD
jgi:hypothetical protein